ncbi:MAG: hypothetical protein A4E66_01993 [Syntrophus sp. PtaB.Bin001]|nr:MAG: hypothetical protein A4E66_01993 [Syntrophus sp. PtaB.Bin001]
MEIDGLSSSGAESFANLLKSITEGRKTIYISVPITTGSIFLQWYQREGFIIDPSSLEYKVKHQDNVISQNCEIARKKIKSIRMNNTDALIIDPTSFFISQWTQEDYHFFWGKIIESCANKVILLDGWQYSAGCCYEFLKAVNSGIETVAENGISLGRLSGSSLISNAIQELKQNSLPTLYLERVIRELGPSVIENTPSSQSSGEYKLHRFPSTVSISQPLYKDEVLNNLANDTNIAQFISFSPGQDFKLRFARIIGINPDKTFSSKREAIVELLSRTEDHLVNIRTFEPNRPKGGEFFYGKNDPDEILSLLSLQASKGLYTIINETIDINDGGVSGVSFANIVEFAPFDTPKCVDKPEVCSLPRAMALPILERVYGFLPALNYDASIRIEFSIHPQKRGLHKDHTIIWEKEKVGTIPTSASIIWPNRFSQMIGDKVFGLLIADAIGLPVPHGIVISRSIAPFSLGRETEKWNTWMRTCPKTRVPGKYPTIAGWKDPFEFMAAKNHKSHSDDYINIASLLIQDGVYAEYSGSLISRMEKLPLIEGVHGRGDNFMVGNAKPEELPKEVMDAVIKQHEIAYSSLGPVEMEWVYDGLAVWIVQLHRLKEEIAMGKETVYPGTPESFQIFDTNHGLESLRALISEIKGTSYGIILRGDVGITSHFGDLLRSAKIPSRIERIS